MLELVYSGDCPYCRKVAWAIRTADIGGKVRLTPIESERGRELVEDHHDEFVHSPHLFTDDIVYYGVGPTAKGLAREAPRAYLPAPG